MAKYLLEAAETFETVIPAREIQMVTLFGGQPVGKPTKFPESRYTTTKGQQYTARNKKDRDNLLATGKWKLMS